MVLFLFFDTHLRGQQPGRARGLGRKLDSSRGDPGQRGFWIERRRRKGAYREG